MVVMWSGCLDRRQNWLRRPMHPASAGHAGWRHCM